MAATIRNTLVTSRGSRKHGAVLLLIVASLLFQMAAPDETGYRLASGILQIGTLVLALHSSDVHCRGHPVVVGIALGGLGALIVAAASSGHTEIGISNATSGVLVLIMLATIGAGVTVDMREQHGVTMHAVTGVVCVYLLIGLVFSYAYGTIAGFGNAPFFAQGTNGDHQDRLYFSFITQTTVGYGTSPPGATSAGRWRRSKL